jgi:hypothetical protein
MCSTIYLLMKILYVLCRGRGSRALLKWFKQGVLVHDASYHVAVQLEGPEVGIASVLGLRKHVFTL